MGHTFFRSEIFEFIFEVEFFVTSSEIIQWFLCVNQMYLIKYIQ